MMTGAKRLQSVCISRRCITACQFRFHFLVICNSSLVTCFHRFLVPEKMPQAEPVQVARTQWTGCWRWLARWWPVAGFAARCLPNPGRIANHPLIFSGSSVEVLMFFTEAVISGRVRCQQAVGGIRHPRQLLRKEKHVADGEAHLRTVGGDDGVDVAHRAHRLFGDRPHIVHGDGKIGERVHVQYHPAQVRDGRVQFLRGLVNALDKSGGGARDLLKVERRLAVHLVAVCQRRLLVAHRNRPRHTGRPESRTAR